MSENQAVRNPEPSPESPAPARPNPETPPLAPPVAAPPVPPGPAALGPRRRFAGIAGIVVAMLLIAVTSGLVGGWVATRSDQDARAPVTTGDGRAAPDLDRSSLADVVEKVQPSVVSVKAGDAEGSGVVLDTEGYVLTNHHVVAQAGDTVTVTFSNGDSKRARVVGTDPQSDLAVLKVDGARNLTPAVFGDSDAVEVGDTVLALGSPLGLEGSVTSGIISAKDRTIRGEQGGRSISGMLQTDAAINPGNSGGPLVNLSGEVIGINTAIATAGNGSGNIGVGFAIPSNTAKRVAEQLIAGKQVSHPYLGVAVADADNGALVQSVTPGSPADRAGLRAGDVITRFGDRAVRDSDDLVAAVQSRRVGDRVEVTYTRDGEQRRTTVTVGESPG